MTNHQRNLDNLAAHKEAIIHTSEKAAQETGAVNLGVTKEGQLIPAREGTSPMPGVWLGGGPMPSRDSNDPNVIYETETEDQQRRLKIGSQLLKLAPGMHVDVQLEPDGSGQVFVTIPASSIKVVPAGKRVVNQRERKRDRDRGHLGVKPEENKPDAD